MNTNPTPDALAELIAPCGHCHGVGDIGDGDHSCMICGGSGTVMVKASRDTIAKFLSEIMARSPNGEPVKVQYHPNGDWTVFDSLEAFHAKPVVGEDECEHCGTTGWGSDHAKDCPNNPVPGHGEGCLSDLAALQSPPPVVSGEAICEHCGGNGYTGGVMPPEDMQGEYDVCCEVCLGSGKARPPVVEEGQRKAVARIIDPPAFIHPALPTQGLGPRWVEHRNVALAKADRIILALTPVGGVGDLRRQAENMWIEFSHLVEGNNREQVIDTMAAELEKLCLSTPATAQGDVRP